MSGWARSIAGLIAGSAQAYAGGMDWKHVLAGLATVVFGVVLHVTHLDSQ
jgi:hypothetical protein